MELAAVAYQHIVTVRHQEDNNLLVNKSGMTFLLYHMPIISGFGVCSRGNCFSQSDAFIARANIIAERLVRGWIGNSMGRQETLAMLKTANKGKLVDSGIADTCSKTCWPRRLAVCSTATSMAGTARSLSIALDFPLRALGTRMTSGQLQDGRIRCRLRYDLVRVIDRGHDDFGMC